MGVKIGSAVEIVDEHGVQHHALVTQVFDNGDSERYPTPAINAVHASSDEAAGDQYGRQLVRRQSVPHKSQQSAPGNYWA